MAVYRLGDQGSAVIEIRAILAAHGLLASDPSDLATITGRHGRDPRTHFDGRTDHAVRAFQQERGLIVDGIVGPATFRVLRESSFRLGARVLVYRLSAPMAGDDVATLQSRLQNLGFYTGLVDGHFGVLTYEALCMYQSDYGMTPDGICGPDTLRSLERLGTRVTGGSPHAIRAEENVRRSGPRLSGKRVVIDPGVGHTDAAVGDSMARLETEILWDLGHRLEGRMGAAGMETLLSHAPDARPDDIERARTANAYDADLVIALRCARYHTPAASGTATFHFGNTHGSVSTTGQSLAGFIQREVVARTDLQDCRTHPRTWDILRLTRMPTAQIDLGYITSPHDAALLSDPVVRDVIADAILFAVKRLYLLGADDRPTGTYTFADLLASEELAY